MAEILAWPGRGTSSRALQLLSTIRQSEFCIALLRSFKNVFRYSIVLRKVMQKKSINLLEALNIAHDIANELKCLREKAEYEFHQLYIFAQETAKIEDFILKTRRLTSRQTNRCNIAAATDEEYFRVGIFIPFLDNFIVILKARFTAHKSIIGEFQCLISADPTSGPTPQQIKSIHVLGKFYKNDLTKSSGELVPELILWCRKLFWLNAERPTDALSSIKECSSDAFSNIFTLMTILLTLPMTTCTSEQSFSTLRRLKTCLRNTIGTTRMNGLALLNIYRSHTHIALMT